MTGHLSGSLDGRPVEISGMGETVDLQFSSIASAWKLRNVDGSTLRPALRMLQRGGIGVTATLGNVKVEVLPKPNFAFRFLAPRVYKMFSGDDN